MTLLFLNSAPGSRIIRGFLFLRAAARIHVCSSNNGLNASCLSRQPASPPTIPYSPSVRGAVSVRS